MRRRSSAVALRAQVILDPVARVLEQVFVHRALAAHRYELVAPVQDVLRVVAGAGRPIDYDKLICDIAALRARGYLVRRLEDGYPEWKAAGMPIEAAV